VTFKRRADATWPIAAARLRDYTRICFQDFLGLDAPSSPS